MMRENISFIAAIEVGSHETLLKIAEIQQNAQIVTVESVSKTINLGSDSYRLGYITNENIHLLIATLKEFQNTISGYQDVLISAVATSALREAANRIFLLDQVKNQTGIEIRILSNREEIAGMNMAIRHKMPAFKECIEKPTLLLDIGAGSTQLTLFDEGQFLFTQNILLGSLRVRDRLSVLEQHTLDFKSLMQEYITGDLDYYRSFVPKKITYQYFVLIGNMLKTWRYLANLPLTDTVILPKQTFLDLYAEITNHSTFSLIQKYEITEEQASMLLPMSMVMKELLEVTNVDSILIPDVTLADGVLFRTAQNLGMMEPDHHNDLDAITFAREIAKRHYTDQAHIEQVEFLALQLFDQLKPEHNLAERYRFLLQIATIFHNIGKFFTIKQDGDIAYQLIKSADLSGLSDEEVELIALLVKYHSKPWQDIFNIKTIKNTDEMIIFAKMSVLLAMANALDTGHKAKIKNIYVENKKKRIKLYLESDQDLTLEIWSFQEPASYFYKVFGKEIRLIRRANVYN